MSVCDGEKVNIYDGRTAIITVSEAVVLKGWRCPCTKLLRIPSRAKAKDLDMLTLVFNVPMGRESINSLYTVLTSAAVLDNIESSAHQSISSGAS